MVILWRDVVLGVTDLRRHGGRSVLTMLGIVFGVASVIAMLAVGNGASREALRQIRQLGSDVIILNAVKPAELLNQGTRHRIMSVYGLTFEDVERIKATVPGVHLLVPVKVRREQVVNPAGVVDVRLVGTKPAWFRLVTHRLMAGRLLTALDVQRRQAVAVVTDTLARRLFPLKPVLGSYVRAGGSSYRVVGVVSSVSLSGMLQSVAGAEDIYVPLSALRERNGDVLLRYKSGGSVRERVQLHRVLLKMARERDVEATAAALRTMLHRFHRRDDVKVKVPLALLRQAERTQRRFNIVLGAIAGISLLVGGIGIMNIMLASVTERTREIGVRRAIGASRADIMRQFIIETVVLAAGGGVLGVLLGFALPWLITRFSGVDTLVTGSSVVLSLLISVAVGLVFGLYPARRAALLNPVEALRHG